jgi:hypothetical protein
MLLSTFLCASAALGTLGATLLQRCAPVQNQHKTLHPMVVGTLGPLRYGLAPSKEAQMARKVFFSFKYEDVSRAMVVRNSDVIRGDAKAGFIDKADFEKVKKQGDAAIKAWIDDQLKGTTVTAVLVGEKTCDSRWVKYEIEASKKRGNGLLGIDISKIKDLNGNTSERCGKLPDGYPFYLWNNDKGYENLGKWIDDAAKAAGH